MSHVTGDPAVEALIAAHQGLRERLDRELRYGQTRWAEVWLACVMTVFGLGLILPGETFSMPSYRVIREFVGEAVAGWVAIAVGTARLIALWYNGSRRRSPLVRLAGCSGGFLFYGALSLGFLTALPDVNPLGLMFIVFAMAELHSSGRSARDVSVLDSLGIRRRRIGRDRLASRD